MGEVELSVALTVLGALIGAVVAPACEILLLRVVKAEHSRIKTGFVLLCSANALWLLSSPLFTASSRHLPTLILLAFIYTLSALFFIGAFRSFQVSDLNNEFLRFSNSVRYLALGNALWIVAEVSEAPLAFFQIDSFPWLLVKYLLFMPPLWCFGRAAIEANRSRPGN